MADLDEMLDLGEHATDEDRGVVRAELEHLLSPAGDDLWTSLTELLQHDMNVATAYAAVRQVLLLLPPAPPRDEAAALHAKHRWAEVRRHHGRR